MSSLQDDLPCLTMSPLGLLNLHFLYMQGHVCSLGTCLQFNQGEKVALSLVARPVNNHSQKTLLLLTTVAHPSGAPELSEIP